MRGFDWRPHLQDGEVLIWQGSPYPALRLVRPSQAEWLVGALGLVGLLALLLLRRAADEGGAPSGETLGATVLLMLVALAALGWPLRGMRRRAQALRRRFYAVTDRRVMTVADGRDPRTLDATALPRRPDPVARPEGGALGTLSLGRGGPELPHVQNAEAVARLIGAVLADPQLRAEPAP